MTVLTRFATLAVAVLLMTTAAESATRKPHLVVLGAAKRVPYLKAGDPAGAMPGEKDLQIRALMVDGAVKEWITGEAHDVTDRSFVVRRVIRVNDSLPGEKPAELRPTASSAWVWQKGPWLLVDRVTGRVTVLKLPDYSPGVSQVSWFRDYAAYCGVTPSGKSLYAVVAQVAARKAVLSKKLAAYDVEDPPQPACAKTEWQRDPMRVTFRPVMREAVVYEIAPGSAVLVEEGGEDVASNPTR